MKEKQFEYKIVHIRENTIKYMNELGKEGWELLFFSMENYNFYYKRLITSIRE